MPDDNSRYPDRGMVRRAMEPPCAPEGLERSGLATELSTAVGGFSCWLPCRPKAVRVSRRLLRDFLAEMDGGDRYVETGALVLTELVTNALRHGRVPGRLVWLRFELSPGQLRVEVHDASPKLPTVREAAWEDESGRGLWLVEQLSTAWGCGPRPGGIGKAVWAVCAPAAG